MCIQEVNFCAHGYHSDDASTNGRRDDLASEIRNSLVTATFSGISRVETYSRYLLQRDAARKSHHILIANSCLSLAAKDSIYSPIILRDH
jgi:hypothetical protein